MEIKYNKDGSAKLFFQSPEDDKVINYLKREAKRSDKSVDEVLNAILKKALDDMPDKEKPKKKRKS